MCTVTIFYKGNNDFVLTSNRDEAPNRESLPPKIKTYKKVELLYPEDKLSGGTWIGVSENKRVICLLNGGFKIHERQIEYRQSRGLVVKDLLSLADINDAHNYDYSGIEPFTLIIADWNRGLCFYEIVWDGKKAHFSILDLVSHIWSSSTLYSEDMKQKRKEWFKVFKSENELSSNTLLNFHKTAGKDNLNFGVVMDRGFVKTTSITQVEKLGENITMRYESLQDEKVSLETLKSSEVINE